jgi:hypothetical protein
MRKDPLSRGKTALQAIITVDCIGFSFVETLFYKNTHIVSFVNQKRSQINGESLFSAGP